MSPPQILTYTWQSWALLKEGSSTSIYYGQISGPVTLAPVADVSQWSCHSLCVYDMCCQFVQTLVNMRYDDFVIHSVVFEQSNTYQKYNFGVFYKEDNFRIKRMHQPRGPFFKTAYDQV